MTGSSQYDTFCSMSKKRRTKKEKMISQVRLAHHITQNSPEEAIYSFEGNTQSKTPLQRTTTHATHKQYAYVLQDMKRSITITSILLLLSAFLFILIQSQIIKLSYFGY